jgi:hypothetical protein
MYWKWRTWWYVMWARLHGCKPEGSGYLWRMRRQQQGKWTWLDRLVTGLG